MAFGVRELTFRTSQPCNQKLQKSMALPTLTEKKARVYNKDLH
jgi:hypothetical protein